MQYPIEPFLSHDSQKPLKEIVIISMVVSNLFLQGWVVYVISPKLMGSEEKMINWFSTLHAHDAPLWLKSLERPLLLGHIIGINSLTSHKPCRSLYFRGGFRLPHELSWSKGIEEDHCERALRKKLIVNKPNEVEDQTLTSW